MKVLLNIPQLNFQDASFFSALEKRLLIDEVNLASSDVDQQVKEIISEVREHGDNALLSYTEKFDGVTAKSVQGLKLDKAQLFNALEGIPVTLRTALETAKKRIEQYHSHQKIETWQFEDEFGHVLGQQVKPLGSVGMYVPGGKASYPSSVLMNAIPAKVAGVKRLCMTVPTQNGELHQLVLAAAALVEVDEVFTIGGAQAVAALAYGTETIAKVDKIVGPGNQYVASAKKQVFGKVGIDMIAGPSEILVYCDDQSNPDWVAMDLFSQAEHDELAQAICICESQQQISAIKKSIGKLLPKMNRADVITNSLEGRGAFILVEHEEEALQVINFIAPEHLELSFEVSRAKALAKHVDSAGAIFIGRASAEAFGDYCAGSNHVLPTYGSAKFSSPLSVYDFVKRSSVIQLNSENLNPLADVAFELANAEGLEAHALSAKFRKS